MTVMPAGGPAFEGSAAACRHGPVLSLCGGWVAMSRREHDFLGEMEIDDSVYYGIQTIRGIAMSDVDPATLERDAPELARAMVTIKKAAALANSSLGALDAAVAKAVCGACDEILGGTLKGQFPMRLLSGGGGVSIHMNVNEVIANRANEILCGKKGYDIVHPNTHVNMGQSTNDVVPSAIHISLYWMLGPLVENLKTASEILREKSIEFKDVVKLGRTCLQDAMPVTLGQEFSGYADLIARQAASVERVRRECLSLPLGATAVGTGSGSVTGFGREVFARLAELTGDDFRQDENLFDGLQNGDIYIRVSSALKAAAAGFSKIAADLRIMSSGPRGGFMEITIPAVLPGSSIMPGKINPILPELMKQIYFQVFGCDAAVTLAAENGELDLNVWEAVIYKNLFEMIRLLTKGSLLFADKCLRGVAANREICFRHAENSTALAAIVSAVMGYETGSRVAREAMEQNKSVLRVVIDSGLMKEDEARKLLAPGNLVDSDVMAESITLARKGLKQGG